MAAAVLVVIKASLSGVCSQQLNGSLCCVQSTVDRVLLNLASALCFFFSSVLLTRLEMGDAEVCAVRRALGTTAKLHPTLSGRLGRILA